MWVLKYKCYLAVCEFFNTFGVVWIPLDYSAGASGFYIFLPDSSYT